MHASVGSINDRRKYFPLLYKLINPCYIENYGILVSIKLQTKQNSLST